MIVVVEDPLDDEDLSIDAEGLAFDLLADREVIASIARHVFACALGDLLDKRPPIAAAARRWLLETHVDGDWRDHLAELADLHLGALQALIRSEPPPDLLRRAARKLRKEVVP